MARKIDKGESQTFKIYFLNSSCQKPWLLTSGEVACGDPGPWDTKNIVRAALRA
jgi:hypothetical protein